MTALRYPRIPHCSTSNATSDDHRLSALETARLLRCAALVEEKLDGSNVRLSSRDGQVQIAPRGRQTMDRARQFGRLKAWCADNMEALSALMIDGSAIFGEWLYLTHSIRYDQLPDYLVVLDIWAPDEGFVSAKTRNARCAAVGLTVPTLLFSGVIAEAQLPVLVGPAAYSSAGLAAEGCVIRDLAGKSAGPVLKWVSASFCQRDDASWKRERIMNQLAPR